jgi:hypothetical protein
MKVAGPYQIAQPYREVEMPVGRCFDIVELVLSFMGICRTRSQLSFGDRRQVRG